MGGKLFSGDTPKICAYCAHADKLQTAEEILCYYKGPVTETFSCRRFTYDPFKRNPGGPVQLRPFPKPPEDDKI